MGGFYRTRGSNRFGVLITFHVLTHVIDLKNPPPPRWGGSLEPVFHQNPPPSRWGGSLEPMFHQVIGFLYKATGLADRKLVKNIG